MVADIIFHQKRQMKTMNLSVFETCLFFKKKISNIEVLICSSPQVTQFPSGVHSSSKLKSSRLPVLLAPVSLKAVRQL